MNIHPLMLLLTGITSLKRGLTTNSVKRNFATIRSVINLAIQEHGLECRNAFSKVYLPDLDDAKKRKPIPLRTSKRYSESVCL
jgi:hypothetical protein